jgi:hypothetical protein
MKALTCQVIITSASTRADGSLGLRLATPELTAPEKVALIELQGQNLKMLLQPAEGEPVELVEVKGEFGERTPGQRLRAVLYLLWRQSGETGIDFEVFYRREMEKLIDGQKAKLPQP